MATDKQLVDALESATAALASRKLTAAERNSLIEIFNQQTGENQLRARRAIQQFLAITPRDVQMRCEASDDTDRAVTDLDNVLINWTPGT